jgi:hypothetical protein
MTGDLSSACGYRHDAQGRLKTVELIVAERDRQTWTLQQNIGCRRCIRRAAEEVRAARQREGREGPPPHDPGLRDRFVCFRFDGRRGLYIHPNIWHEGVFGLGGTQRFFDRQGAVHARVSVDFAREFGCRSRPCCRVPEAALARA